MKFKPFIASLLILLTPLSAMSAEPSGLLEGVLDELKALVDLSKRVKLVEDQLAEIPVDHFQDYNNRIEALREGMNTLAPRIESLENRPIPEPVVAPASNPYQFILKDENGDGDVDEEWEAIITKGQAIQAKVWIEKEKYWTDLLGTPPAGELGWYGTSTMPTIQIVCLEGEYFFHDTARLPGRFQVTCPTRWGSMLRFYGDGDKVIVDDIAYGIATNSPIGIYVEPKTVVETENGTMTVKPFEQQIERVIIVGMKGVMPVYLAQNQDRFAMLDCNLQQHQGSMIGIKHGPPLQGRSYPFPATQVLDGNTYLADPRILDCQLEGPHSGARKQAAIFMSGNNMIFRGLNFYGWTTGILCHGGQGRVVDSITMHDGVTADGRRFTSKDNILAVALSTRPGVNEDSVSGVAGGFKVWVLPKRSPAPATAGWYVKGEGLL